MSKLDYELQLFKETLDWVKTKKLPPCDDLISHYERYYQFASTHTPILTEDWGEHNTRHGARSVRGTTSEMLAAVAFHASGEQQINQITNRVEQDYGVDLKIGQKQDAVSCKTANSDRQKYLRLYREYFEPAEWRVKLITLAHPETKQVWVLTYPLLANVYCKVYDKGLFTPTFEGDSVPFNVETFKTNFPEAFGYMNLSKEI